ncbi:MAG: PKD domain-containing protein, partial [Bacteroidales bacterium]|nr:PKD domain-containing protein [Bacteroidales bacterium]
AIGNKPAVKFDGVNDFMRVDFGQTFAQPNTIFSVWNRTSSGTAVNTVFDGINSSNRHTLQSYNNLIGFFAGTIRNYSKTPPFEIIFNSILFNSSSSFINENKILKNSGNTSNNSLTGLNIGSIFSNSQYLNGHICEIIFFDSVLTSNHFLTIEKYINNKYNPEVQLEYDITVPNILCDTVLTGANKPWFTNWLWSTGDTTPTIRAKQSGKYWVRATNIFGIVSSDTIMVNYAGHQTFADTTICLGDTLIYTYNKDLPYQINWSNGDTGKVFKTTLPGNYSMTLTDSLGCSWQTSFIVNIDSFPNSNLLPENTTLCAGNQIQANVSPNTVSYLWSPNGEETSYITIFQSGTYHLTAQNARGCQAHDSIAVIIQGVAPNPNFEWSLACTNDSVHFFNLSSPMDSIASFSWNINNGYNSTLQNPSFIFDTMGIYSAKLSISSFSGCNKDTTLNVNVYKSPTANFEHLSPCINTPTPFINLSDLNQGYTTQSVSWYINNDISSTEINPELSFNNAQEYQVSLVIQSSNFCSDSISKSIIIPSSYPHPDNFTTVYPINNSQIGNSIIQFRWNASEQAQYYRFELSNTATFSSIIETQWLIAEDFPNTYNTIQLTNNAQYFWRIKAFNPCLDSLTSSISNFHFYSPSFANTEFWFAADTGIVISNGTVTQWNDISGKSKHAIQSTLANQPTFLPTNIILNNKPTINFDGTNDNFIISNSSKIGSVFIVSNWGSTASIFPNYVSMLGSAVSHSKFVILAGDQNKNNLYTGSVSLFSTNIKINNNNTSIFSPLNSFKISYGNVSSNSEQYSSLQIGGQTSSTGRYWNGNIAEIIAFDTVLTTIQQNNVYNYLSTKYAPSVTLGYEIKMPYLLCDTAITGANKPWFTNWLWSTGDTNPTIRINQSGIVWVRATNIFGIVSSDTIMVYYTGHQTFSDTTICLGDTLTYTYTKDLPYQINWSNGDTGKVFKTTLPGNYSMTLTDSLGCSWQTSFIVSIDSFPNFNLLPENVTLCAGNQIQANIHPNTASYLWSPGNESSSLKKVFQSDTYRLTAQNAHGCQAQDSIAVTIQGVAPNPNFQWSLACTNDSIHFINLSHPIDSIASYSWNFNNGFNSNLINPSFVFDTAGTYSANLSIDSYSGCNKDTTIQFQVYKKPHADFEHLLPCINTPTPFYNLSDLNQGYITESISWYINDNLASNEIHPELSFSDPQEFMVSLVVQSTNGCSDSISKNLNILGSYPNPENFSLVYPQNNVQTSESFIQFQWNFSENAQYYRFELSDTANFSNIIESQWLIAEDFPKTYNSNPISDNKNYFWKITAFNPCFDSLSSSINKIQSYRPFFTNIEFWFAADTGVVISGGKVTQWNDISGKNKHAIQSIAANQPTFIPINTTLNSKPIINFNGISNNFIISNSSKIGSVFIVSNWGTDLTNFPNYVSMLGSAVSHTRFVILAGDQNKNNLYTGTGSLFSTNIKINNNNTSVFSPLNSFKISYGNVSSNSEQYSSLQIGGQTSTTGRYWNGNIAEIIALDTAITVNEQNIVFNYLSSKYAPSVSLGYDIKMPYLLCDTAITEANKPWFTNWLWSTGDTTSTIRVNQSGKYWVRATNIFGLVSSDTIMVNYAGHQTFADTTICLGDTLTYTYNKDLPYQINWSNGDTGNAFKTTLPGNYSMTLTDSLGCSWQTSFQVQLDSLPALLSLGHDRALCTGQTLIPNLGSAQSQNLSYLWMDNSTAPSIIVQNPGEYSLQVSNQRGCIAYDTVQISLQGITPIPAFDALGVCLGNATLFTDASSSPDGSDIITWQWDFGDLNFANTQNPSNTYLQSGIYPVKLRVITENLCAAEMTSSVAVYSLPSAQFSPLTACAQTPLNFRDNSVSEYSINDWNWQFNNPYHPNPSSNIQNPTHTFDSAGTYSVQLIVKNIFSCSDTITKEVEIRPGAMADFSANTACEGTNTWFNSTTQTASFNPIVSYRWEYSTLFRDSLPVSSFRFDTAGIYPVKHSI